MARLLLAVFWADLQSLSSRFDAAVWGAVQVFVISSHKIQEHGYETLYQFATANDRSLFGRVVLRAPKTLQACRCASGGERSAHVYVQHF